MIFFQLTVGISAIAIIALLNKILTELQAINDEGCIKLNVNIDVKKLAHDLAKEVAEQDKEGEEHNE